MIDRPAEWVARAAGGELLAGDAAAPGPERAVVDSRAAGPGDLFAGLPGARADGGTFAPAALAAGAWGVLVSHETAEAAVAAATASDPPPVVIAVHDPLAALGRLARAWRRELGCDVIGVTGSTGKTSTKDLLVAVLGPHRRTHANRENLNTEVGLPLSVLEAQRGTEVLVLEMGMRGSGQIAELAAIAEPTVGVVINVGPVHLELLHTVERVAAAKAELIAALPAGAGCVVPADEPLLRGHLRDDLHTVAFGPGGQVVLRGLADGRARIEVEGEAIELEVPFTEDHNVRNLLAAVAAAGLVGVTPSGRVDVRFSSFRGQEVDLGGGVTVINDCYNANPMSMRAALDHLAARPAQRRIAVLGPMAELGEGAPRFHREVGERAAELGIDVLVPVGEGSLAYLDGYGAGEIHPVATPEEAGALLGEIAHEGDRVLIKGSRSAGLERVLGS